jgi:hypothetical protein
VCPPSAIAAPTPMRIAASALVAGGSGLVLGVAFPAGMRLVRAAHDEEAPWFWGTNGMTSVLASSLALIVALQWGLRVVLLVAAACYLLLVPAVSALQRASVGARPKP